MQVQAPMLAALPFRAPSLRVTLPVHEAACLSLQTLAEFSPLPPLPPLQSLHLKPTLSSASMTSTNDDFDCDACSPRSSASASTVSSSLGSPTSGGNKCSLAFILDGAPSADKAKAPAPKHQSRAKPYLKRRSSNNSKSKYCIVEGCTSRAKHARRCWKHGGSVKCKVPECVNRAKSRGVCWSHGGGTTCSYPNCGTIAVSHGYCWAHGGGKRCQVEGCSRPAYERTQNYCSMHFKQSKTAA